MTAKKKTTKKKTAAKKTTKKKTTGKKTAAKKTTKKKSARKKRAAKKPSPEETTGGRKPAKREDAPSRGPARGGDVTAADVNLGHVFALRPRVNASFSPEHLRRAKDALVEERFASLPEAARAVAEKALDLTREDARSRGR